MPLATLAFDGLDVPLELCRHARELWWEDEQNKIGPPAQLECLLATLPRGGEVYGFDDALSVGLDEPRSESESIERLKDLLRDRPEDCLAIVCHWGVINALCGASADNAMMVDCCRSPNGEIDIQRMVSPPKAPQTR